MTAYGIPALAALLAGAVNVLAGGGSFISFPALVLSGLPAVTANATNTTALLPASVAGAHVYREHFQAFEGVSTRALFAASALGGMVGAVLLLVTPERGFDAVVPWLLLVSTLSFAYGERLGPSIRRSFRLGPRSLLATQFLLSVYCGYFGAAVGLMMMAAWTVFGVRDIRAMNAAKNLMVVAANVVAVICFAIGQQIRWPQALTMSVGAAAGGYAAGHLAKRMNPRHVRAAIHVANVVITTAFFVRAYRLRG